jgi:hypothetical protein
VRAAWKAPNARATSAPIRIAPSNGHKAFRDLLTWVAIAEAAEVIEAVVASEVVAADDDGNSSRY